MSLPTATALFPDKAAALVALRADLQLGAIQYLQASLMTIAPAADDLLWGKLVAAEADAEKKLKTFFNTVQIIPDNAPDTEIAALETAGTRYSQEAAYDFESGMFLPDEFGMIQLGYTPVQAINRATVMLPSPGMQSFDVPLNWIRLDKKYGHLRFFPTTTPIGIPAGTLGIGFLSYGSYPNAIEVRYTAGLKNANGVVASSYAVVWNDLIEVVKKMAIMNLVRTSYVPNSGSISGDGLSESRSIDMEKWQDGINAALFGPKGSNGGLYTAIHGITMGLLG